MGLHPKNLFGAILLFILLDLSILAINYWIAYQISRDAVAINLSGRQRMLSQRITKTLLLLDPQASAESSRVNLDEFRLSVRMFDQTLLAFERGGAAIGGDGKEVTLNPVGHDPAGQLVEQALQIWRPMHERMQPYLSPQAAIPAEIVSQARSQMIQDNLALLDLMNRLTSSLERHSLNRANTLRIVQTTVFILALINFLVIVHRFHLLAQQSARTSQHYTELAMRDPLTGLFNRRQFEDDLEREMAAVDRRPHSNLALVMVDLDEFKPVNDEYGHETGDQVLRAVATRLSENARINDTVARIGGDEFTLICPDLSNREDAAAFCQRLLDSINLPITVGHVQIRMGASIGIAFYPDHCGSVGDLVRLADKAMYAAKNAGRNRYVCFDPALADAAKAS